MTYLTAWRLALAADRLLEPRATIETVARDVGYSSAFALSAALKKHPPPWDWYFQCRA